MDSNIRKGLLGCKLLCVIIVVFLCSCATTKSISGYYDFKTECLGVAYDGSQTLKVWGDGVDEVTAIEQAKKRAVRDVVLYGISSGSAECNQKPLVLEVNAEERYENYFNAFFSDSGKYNEYVFLYGDNSKSSDAVKSKQGVKYGVTVKVLRSELKEQLKADGIIK